MQLEVEKRRRDQAKTAKARKKGMGK
jgi:hypothetical protein